MVLIMEGVLETTSLIASIKSVPLRNDPWGMPLSWEWMDERWLPIRPLNDRSSEKLWIRILKFIITSMWISLLMKLKLRNLDLMKNRYFSLLEFSV